jgi:hypothetical protein
MSIQRLLATAFVECSQEWLDKEKKRIAKGIKSILCLYDWRVDRLLMKSWQFEISDTPLLQGLLAESILESDESQTDLPELTRSCCPRFSAYKSPGTKERKILEAIERDLSGYGDILVGYAKVAYRRIKSGSYLLLFVYL